MQINVSYDSSVASAPSGFITAVSYVVSYFDSLFTNNTTINIDVGYGEVDGQTLGANALGESLSSFYLATYSSVKAALVAETAPGSSTLPSSSPLGGTVELTPAEAKALHLITTSSGPDGYVGFSSAPNAFSYASSTPPSNKYYFIGVVEHEITEIMGRISLVDEQPSWYGPMDLFRYSSPGQRDLTGGRSGSTAYFSIDNGATNLGSWNNNVNNGDLGDWYPKGPASGGNDAFNDYSYPGVINQLSSSDLTLIEALGWMTGSSSTPYVAPTVTGEAFSVPANQPVSLAPYIAVSNPSGDNLTAYYVEDAGGGSGHLTVGGTIEPDGQFIQVSPNWSNVQYVGGSWAGTDTLYIVAFDSITGSYIWSSSTVTAATTAASASPNITGESFTVPANQSVSLPPYVTVSNPSGDSLTAYYVEDAGGGSGHLTVGGTIEPDEQFIQVSPNWSNVQYVGGSSAGTDTLYIVAFDSTTGSYIWSSSSVTATTTAASVPPNITGESFLVPANQSVSLSSYVTLSNPSSDNLSVYYVEDVGGGSGHLTVGGAIEPDGQFIQVSPNWSNVQYVGGSSAGTDTLYIVAFDSTTGSYIWSSSSLTATTTGTAARGLNATQFSHSIAESSHPANDATLAYQIGIDIVRNFDGSWSNAIGTLAHAGAFTASPTQTYLDHAVFGGFQHELVELQFVGMLDHHTSQYNLMVPF